VTAQGDQKIDEAAKILIPAAFMFLLWISTFTCGQYLLTSTIEEKSSRVMEVILSAVSPMQLLTGKILGQMCVGLVILVVYCGLGMAGLVVASMMSVIDPINLVYLAVYFVIAFFIIASLMAAVGSAVSDVREAQSLLGPVMIILIIPMMLWLPILRNPNSTFAQVCSFIPPISPFVMVLRLSGSEPVPFWQVIATVLLGGVTILTCLWAAGKVFRVGVLMYGKPPDLRTLIRWIRMA
jgi:ABC-2 type transport system permease protein